MNNTETTTQTDKTVTPTLARQVLAATLPQLEQQIQEMEAQLKELREQRRIAQAMNPKRRIDHAIIDLLKTGAKNAGEIMQAEELKGRTPEEIHEALQDEKKFAFDVQTKKYSLKPKEKKKRKSSEES